MNGFSNLMFDLDGTLINSAADICASVNRALKTMGRPAISIAETKSLVGFPAPILVKKALNMTGQPGSRDEIDFLLSGFLDSYRHNPGEHTVLFPDAREVLERFSGAGFGLGICTNKPQATCFPVLEALDLKRFFTTVIYGDTLDFRKPDPRHIFHTLEVMDASLDSAAFIDDSEVDIKATNNAGLPSILVTFGYCHVPLDSLGANTQIDHFNQLDETLKVIAGH